MIEQSYLPLFEDRGGKQPLVVAYGMGLDSTAVLVEFARLQIIPDLILFANVGGPYLDHRGCEKEETYAYLDVINPFLRREGMPEVTVVHYTPKDFKNWPPYYSLEQNCLTNGTLPSVAFGFGSCSQKWKAGPQHQFIKRWKPAQDAWKAGLKVKKVIGYDCGPRDIRRSNQKPKKEDLKYYEFWHPLVQWKWDREACTNAIRAAGLPVPLKSSCFFCTAMKPWEVDELPEDKLKRIVLLEARAAPRLISVEGLWRSSVAGKKKGTVPRPGSMTKYIRDKGLLPADEVDRIIAVTPKEIELYQNAFRSGQQVNAFGVFVDACLNPKQKAA